MLTDTRVFPIPMHFSLKHKLGFLTLVPVMAILLALANIYRYVDQTAHDTAFVEEIGRLRMYAERLMVEADEYGHHGVQAGKAGVLADMARIDNGLARLRRRTDSPVGWWTGDEGAMDRAVGELSRRWAMTRQAAVDVVNAEPRTAAARRSVDRLQARTEAVPDAVERLLGVYERLKAGGRQEMRELVTAAIGLGAVSLFLGVFVALRHSGAQREAVAAAEQSENNLRSLADSAYDGILVNCNGRHVFANRRMAQMLGYDPDELIGTRIGDLLSPTEPPIPECRYTECCSACRLPRPFRDVMRRKDGTEIRVEVSAASGQWRGQPASIIIVRDVSERERAEAHLRETEERLRQITDNIHEVFFMRDLGSDRLSYVSPAYAAIWGRPVQALYDNPLDFVRSVHPDDREQVKAGLAAQRENGYSWQEYRIVRPDGMVRWIRSRTFPVRDQQGRIYRIAGVAEDVTAQKHAAEALEESERKYRLFMEHASDAIVLADREGRLCDCNRRAEELLGYSREELVGCTVDKLHPTEALPAVRDAFDRMAREEVVLAELPVVRKDGTQFIAEINSTFIRAGDTVLAHGIFRDVTARRQAEEQRLAREKKQRDALVREVHHRIKNSLQGVAGLLRQYATRHEPLREALEGAIGQVHSMAVVHGLQGQRRDGQLALCEMTEAIGEAASRLTGRGVEVRCELEAPSQIVLGSDEAVPFALVLNELLFNAVKHSPPPAGSVAVHIAARGEGAAVTIHNRGSRLPPGFDFARQVEVGTGLQLVRSLLPPSGLSVSFSDSSDGVITEVLLNAPVLVSPGSDEAPSPL